MNFADIKRGDEHIPLDRCCTENGVFNVDFAEVVAKIERK